MEFNEWEEFRKAKEYLLSHGFKTVFYERDGFLGEELTEVFVKDQFQVNLDVNYCGFFCKCNDENLQKTIYQIAHC